MIHLYKYPVEIGEKVTSKLDHLPQKPFTLRETRRSYISSDILFVSMNLSVN